MNTNKFILNFLNRSESLFAKDLENSWTKLNQQISGKNILVIGGAGTIGSSFIKAALKFRPNKLIVVDINENGLTELVRDLRSTNGQYIPPGFYTYPLSFHNSAFVKLFKEHEPIQIVANFAAHKHVRSEKDIYSIEAMLDNNLIKAKGLMEFLVDHKPEHFFCVSTDKAANPVNIMGASKRLMEELIFSYSNQFKVSTARFANVAFSNGSLLEGFVKRIEKEQPISCPVDVNRFFVAPQEAGEICLMACILSNTSEIFFPKLDKTKDLVNFADIFPSFLKELGFIPYICQSEEEARSSMYLVASKKYPVYLFKTDTSGEKLYEEFYTEDDDYALDYYESLGVIRKKPSYSSFEMTRIIEELKEKFSLPGTNKAEIVLWLKKFVPEFDHIETLLSLDNKM